MGLLLGVPPFDLEKPLLHLHFLFRTQGTSEVFQTEGTLRISYSFPSPETHDPPFP